MFIRLKNKFVSVLENARWRSLPQSITNSILAVVLALNNENFCIANAFCAVIGVVCTHLSANLFDDYFDYIQGKVEIRNKVKGARGLKCASIVNRTASLNDILFQACLFGTIAMLTGMYFILIIGLPILYFILAGAFLAIFYSAPPLKLSYRGLGELVTGLMFGPLLIGGVYYALTCTITAPVMLLSAASGLTVTNIIYVHSILDIQADEACGKKTLAVILKNDFLRFLVLFIFTFTPYIIVFTVSKFLGTILLVTLPAAVYILYVMRDKKRHKILFRFLPPKCRRLILSSGCEYFYTRWLLARNLMAVFTTIAIIYYIIEAFKV